MTPRKNLKKIAVAVALLYFGSPAFGYPRLIERQKLPNLVLVQSGQLDDSTLSDALEKRPEAKRAFEFQVQMIQTHLNEVVQAILPHLPTNDRKLMRSIRFQINLDDGIRSVFAVPQRGDTPPSIQMSFMYISFIQVICGISLGSLDIGETSQDEAQANELMRRLDVMARIAVVREAGGQPDISLLADFNGFAQSAMLRSVSSSELANQSTTCATEILLFTILHEFKHIVENDNISGLTDAQIRNKEYRADQYAAEVMSKASMSVFPAIHMLLFQSMYQLVSNEHKPQEEVLAAIRASSHPFASCRLEPVLVFGVGHLNNDRVFQRRLRRSAQMRSSWSAWQQNTRNFLQASRGQFCG